MTWYITPDHGTYEGAREAFEWGFPEGYNLAWDFLRKHDDLDRPALKQGYPDGRRETYSFRDLDELSNQVANALAARGVGRGDRVAIVVPQKPANPVTHLACWKLGAISLPLSVLFGDDALRYRLRDSGARVVVADEAVLDTVAAVRGDCPDLEHVVAVDAEEPADDVERFEAVRAGRDTAFDIVDTDEETPAVIIYTSGSTGPPKGVLHTHGLWPGHCPAFYMYFERDVFDATYWTPADWAWIGALGDVVFPAWHYGQPVVSYPMGSFDPETAFELAEEFGVTDAFLPPTAIRMMIPVEDPLDRYDLALETVCSGGEPLTPEILDWADETLDGVAVNELYGQTEANLLVTNCRDWFPAQASSMGKPVVGHDVAIVDQETGAELDDGEVGTIAVARENDPVVFEEYWNEPERTAAASVDGPDGTTWHLTGDLGYRDDDGYFWFKTRDDDVIITSGYRVGPGEVERAILEHPDVAQAGVVGVPHETRGEVIKAFVEPVAGRVGDETLKQEIQALVRNDLAKYEYPREIEFADELPTTTTGKIQRRKLRERDD
ncbi:AMP-dependent synthetase [Haloglomus irregulare]|jgi:acetyl-CoA synthetase|uniref:AMP-dependent synthetase n=1 Tax=Haloglomus irregulare TaxID=2234134 RepID=A0A554N9G5_9EURY|nr:AMP-binding protein [Haloglomus irregulare]TSD14002.1 AMP-dependent synthetase [Haloglomus irregulare]